MPIGESALEDSVGYARVQALLRAHPRRCAGPEGFGKAARGLWSYTARSISRVPPSGTLEREFRREIGAVLAHGGVALDGRQRQAGREPAGGFVQGPRGHWHECASRWCHRRVGAMAWP